MAIPSAIKLANWPAGAASATFAALVTALLSVSPPAAASEPTHTSSWEKAQTVQVRAIGGGVADASGTRHLHAGLELALEDGWKTYWRNPGYSGVPPRVDFARSENVASAKLLFPAPRRFKDPDGDTIGYKNSVVWPVAVVPKDPSKPVKLHMATEFGICRDVCIPVQPSLTLLLPPGADAHEAGDKLRAAVARVPRQGASGASTPSIKRISTKLSGPKPSIAIEAIFPGAPDGGDIFLEAPDGIWIPLPKPSGTATDGVHSFVVDLTDGADLADLKDRTIRVTLVSAVGQAETVFKFAEAR